MLSPVIPSYVTYVIYEGFMINIHDKIAGVDLELGYKASVQKVTSYIPTTAHVTSCHI